MIIIIIFSGLPAKHRERAGKGSGLTTGMLQEEEKELVNVPQSQAMGLAAKDKLAGMWGCGHVWRCGHGGIGD